MKRALCRQRGHSKSFSGLKARSPGCIALIFADAKIFTGGTFVRHWPSPPEYVKIDQT